MESSVKVTSTAEIPVPQKVRDLITSLEQLPPDASVTFGERIAHPYATNGIIVLWQEERPPRIKASTGPR